MDRHNGSGLLIYGDALTFAEALEVIELGFVFDDWADDEYYPLDELTECEHCGEPIGTWVHSQAGPYKATAWTHVRPGDPRDNQYCYSSPTDETWDKASPGEQ